MDGDPADPHSLVGPYIGYELVRGTLDGRTGTFVLAASGDHSGGVARTDVTVVPGSGTGELAGLRGAGHYAADAMEYTISHDDGRDLSRLNEADLVILGISRTSKTPLSMYLT